MEKNTEGLFNTYHQILKIQQIDKLLKMLEVMDPPIANMILRKFSKKISTENPGLYQELRKSLMDPMKVLEGLDQQEVHVLWKSLTLDDREVIASRIDSGLLYTFGINPDDYDEEFEVKQSVYWQSTVKFYETFHMLQEEGRIRPLELLENHIRVPKCYTLDASLVEQVRVIQKDLVIAPEEMIQLGVYRGHYPHQSCTLRMAKSDDRGTRTYETETIRFDATGFTKWNSIPVNDPGMYEIIFEETKSEEQEYQQLARVNILVAETDERCFEIELKDIQWASESVCVEANLLFKNAPATVELSAQLICGCGSVIDETWSQVEEGKLNLEFEFSDHFGPWFIYICSFQTDIKGMIPLLNSSDMEFSLPSVCMETEDEATELNYFPVSIVPDNPSELVNGVLAISNPTAFTYHLQEQFCRTLNHHQYKEGRFVRFNSQLTNKMIQLKVAERPPDYQLQQVKPTFNWKEMITFTGEAIPAYWKLAFFQAHDKQPFSTMESELPTPPERFSFNFPDYILPGDRVEGNLVYQVDKPLSLVLDNNGEESTSRITKSGSVPMTLTSECKVSITASDNAEVRWQSEWDSLSVFKNSRTLSKRFRLVKAGDELSLKNGLLYPNLRHWILHVAVALQAYTCRCAEQSSSIVGGLCIIKHLLGQGHRSKQYNSAIVNQMLDKELNHLSSLQGPTGAMSLWQPEGDSPEFNSTPGLNIVVLENLKRLGGSQHETAGILLNKLKGVIKKANTIPYDNPMEKLLLNIRSKGADKKIEDKLLGVFREHLQLVGSVLTVDMDDHFKYDQYFMGVMLECLCHLDFPEIDYTATKKESNLKEKGLLFELLDLLHIRKLKEEKKVNTTYAHHQDPVYFILDSLVRYMGGSGYWGTNSTVRILESLLLISKKRDFKAEFQLEGESANFTPSKVIRVKDKSIKVISGEAIVAETVRENEIDRILNLSSPPPDKFKGSISIQSSRENLRLGATYPMMVQFTSDQISNPLLEIYQSGFLKFNNFEDNTEVASDRLMMAVYGKRTIPVTAIRRGEGRLLCRISDMYDPFIAYRMEVPITVE
jgi:hypothetical protein